MIDKTAVACVGGLVASRMVDHTPDLASLDSAGRWIVVVDFDGAATCIKFADWQVGSPADIAGSWRGPSTGSYQSSLTRPEYIKAVELVRFGIAEGTLYQANVCRILSAELPDSWASDVTGLAALLEHENPAPFAACVRVPELGIEIASASPELFLRRQGRELSSGPIKGTARTQAELTEKDEAENVMIVDLVRNDLGRVCVPGSVAVPSLLRVEEHPTVVHLVSTVAGTLEHGTSWPQIFEATFPPGSVTGAPKYSAMQLIAELEPRSRGPYCGAIGMVNADRSEATLAVGIRTFWLTGDPDSKQLNFGTGAGITWGSNPDAEWEESALKARHLTMVAAGEWT